MLPMRNLYGLLLLLLISSGAFAQKWEVGGFAGSSGYMGEFNEINPLKLTDFALGAAVKYNFNPYFSARLGYTYGTIRGADSTASSQQLRDRNLSFYSGLNELALTGELNFFKYEPGISVKRWSPFIFSGVALVGYNPQANYNGTTYDLRSLKTEGQQKEYSSTAISIPYGVGLKVNFYKSWNLALELGYRTAFTGYLDDVSGNYADKNSMPNAYSRIFADRSGEKTGIYTGSTGSQRGDLRSRDTYMMAGFSLSFTFLSQKCFY
ncbi:MAG: hypothetical protein EOP41_01415 [Sphingobacteriaceae bacterium]|nr:MAG: hypothetical protein EOP41_01415 [Sphingobacteriaceae bacterium]